MKVTKENRYRLKGVVHAFLPVCAAALIMSGGGRPACAVDAGAPSAQKKSNATPGSKKNTPAPGKTADKPGKKNLASPVQTVKTPTEQFQIFEAVAASLAEASAKSVDHQAGGTKNSSHPLTQFLVANLNDYRADGVDEVSPAALSDSLLPLIWRLSPAFPDTSEQWIKKALKLGQGYYRLGLTADAVGWLDVVDNNTSIVRLKAQARHLLIYHYTIKSDSVGLVRMARSWQHSLTSGDFGKRATLALVSALYLRGERKQLLDITSRYRSLSLYHDFFHAHYCYNDGDYERSKDLIIRVLSAFLSDRTETYPFSVKLSALILAADIDWVTGMDGVAAKEYALLAGIDHGYVKPWSLFMLGSIAMHNDEYLTASERFGELSRSHRGSTWYGLSVTLEKHSSEMAELKKAGE